LLPLIWQTAQLSRDYDVIYANTQKALVVGAISVWFIRTDCSKKCFKDIFSSFFDVCNICGLSPYSDKLHELSEQTIRIGHNKFRNSK